MSPIHTICLLGFGEVGSTLADDLMAGSDADIVAWDILFEDPSSRSSQRFALQTSPKIEKAENTGEAVHNVDLVISAVTADQAISAAESVVHEMNQGAWYLDLNSVSPGTKIELSALMADAGARFVEAAVMAPIEPKRIGAPIFLAGAHATEFLPIARTLGFTGMSVLSAKEGQAAASKMCRSVVIKGMEALITEAMLTARHFDVEQAVLDSLNNLFPHPDWQAQSAYFISRSLEHGIRRAEEMREVAKTEEEAGVDAWMGRACVERQQWAGELGLGSIEPDLPTMLDKILSAAAKAQSQTFGN